MSPPFPASTAPRPPSEARRRRRRRRLRRLGSLILGLAVVSFLAARYRLIWVVGDSMLPTFHSGQVIVVDTWTYRRSGPIRGDVVVARHHDEWVVKRVVGLPGETVEVRNGHVEVEGVSLEVEHPSTNGLLNIRGARLMDQRFAILGDNRGGDPSTFVHAVVGPEQLLGKVILPGSR